MDKIFCEKEVLKRFFGLAIGLSATGYSHKSVFVAYGPASNNGKSVTFDVVRDVLGGYPKAFVTCFRECPVVEDFPLYPVLGTSPYLISISSCDRGERPFP